MTDWTVDAIAHSLRREAEIFRVSNPTERYFRLSPSRVGGAGLGRFARAREQMVMSLRSYAASRQADRTTIRAQDCRRRNPARR